MNLEILNKLSKICSDNKSRYPEGNSMRITRLRYNKLEESINSEYRPALSKSLQDAHKMKTIDELDEDFD